MQKTNRREFLNHSAKIMVGAGVVCLGGLTGCSRAASAPQISAAAYKIEAGGSRVLVALADVPELTEVGGAVKILDSELPQNLIIAHTEDTEYVALSIACTHGGNEVGYQTEQEQFKCTSFGGSTFGLDGSKLGGPAKGPLQSYRTGLDLQDEGLLIIDLVVV